MDAQQLLYALLAGGAGAALITGLWSAVTGWVKDRRNRNHKLDEDETTQLARLKAAAERHLMDYDVPMRERMFRHEALINDLRAGQGKDPIVFPPPPPIVPLLEALDIHVQKQPI